jgi:hypothetical protein
VKWWMEFIMPYALLVGLAFVEHLNTYFVPWLFKKHYWDLHTWSHVNKSIKIYSIFHKGLKKDCSSKGNNIFEHSIEGLGY